MGILAQSTALGQGVEIRCKGSRPHGCFLALHARLFSPDMAAIAKTLHFALLQAKGRGNSLFHRK
jgi:hypothetical protein